MSQFNFVSEHSWYVIKAGEPVKCIVLITYAVVGCFEAIAN